MPCTLLWKWTPPLKTADLVEEVATKLWNLLAAQRLFANETTIQCRLLKIHIYKTLDIQTTGVNYKYAAGGAKPEVLHRIFIDDAD